MNIEKNWVQLKFLNHIFWSCYHNCHASIISCFFA